MTRSAAVTGGVEDVHQRQRTVDDASGFVKGINPAPHIHEHLRYTIMVTALRTPSRITTSRLSTLR